MFTRKRKTTEEPAVLARPITLGDVADTRRAMATYVERPDQYTALDHLAATRPVDREGVLGEVRTRVQAALSTGALDEYSDDFLDAWIDELRAGWDDAVLEQRRHRLAALQRLAAMELHDLTLTQAQVTAARERIAMLTQRVDGWRAVLYGATWHPGEGITVDPAPQAPLAVNLDVALTAGEPQGPATGDLSLFEADLAATHLHPTLTVKENN